MKGREALLSQKRLSHAARHTIQIALVVLVVAGASLRNLQQTGILPFSLPELQGLSPIGAAQNLGRLLSGNLNFGGTGAWVLTGLLGTALIMGAVFCGRLCPLGTIQEWVGRLGSRVFGRRYNRFVPPQVDRLLGKLRCLVAAMVVLTGSMFVERPWCRWLCPFGAVLSTLGLLSPLTIRRDTNLCTNCGRCSRACPFTIKVSSVKAVRDDRCNRCTRCLEACPAEGALSYGVSRKAGAGVFRISPMMTIAKAASAAGIETVELLLLLSLNPNFDPDLALIDIEEMKGYEHVTFGRIRELLEMRETH